MFRALSTARCTAFATIFGRHPKAWPWGPRVSCWRAPLFTQSSWMPRPSLGVTDGETGGTYPQTARLWMESTGFQLGIPVKKIPPTLVEVVRRESATVLLQLERAGLERV